MIATKTLPLMVMGLVGRENGGKAKNCRVLCRILARVLARYTGILIATLSKFFCKRTNKIQDSNIQPLKTLKLFELARPVGKQSSNLCISQFQLRSAPHPHPPHPRADPGH